MQTGALFGSVGANGSLGCEAGPNGRCDSSRPRAYAPWNCAASHERPRAAPGLPAEVSQVIDSDKNFLVFLPLDLRIDPATGHAVRCRFQIQ